MRDRTPFAKGRKPRLESLLLEITQAQSRSSTEMPAIKAVKKTVKGFLFFFWIPAMAVPKAKPVLTSSGSTPAGITCTPAMRFSDTWMLMLSSWHDKTLLGENRSKLASFDPSPDMFLKRLLYFSKIFCFLHYI